MGHLSFLFNPDIFCQFLISDVNENFVSQTTLFWLSVTGGHDSSWQNKTNTEILCNLHIVFALIKCTSVKFAKETSISMVTVCINLFTEFVLGVIYNKGWHVTTFSKIRE